MTSVMIRAITFAAKVNRKTVITKINKNLKGESPKFNKVIMRNSPRNRLAPMRINVNIVKRRRYEASI